MPYLPLDLDAKRLLEGIEKGLLLPRHTMVGGAMDMWEAVWRQKSAFVDNITLWAAFGPDERVVPALVSRGFLEPSPDGRYRVCGAEQWLFGMSGKSRGGHAAKGNLIPGPKPKRQPKDSAEGKSKAKSVSSASAEGQPKDPLGTSSALSPSIPSSQQALTTSPQNAEGDGWQALVKELFAVFRGDRGKDPEPSGKDWKALKKLRERTRRGDREIVVRWGRGLKAQFKQRVDSFSDLDAKWDSLATGDPPKRAGSARFFAAQDADPTAFAKTGTADDF